MTIDLGNLSSKELDTLITKAKKRKVALKKRKPAAAVRRKISALAKAEGYTVAELFGGAGAAGATGRAGRAPRKASATIWAWASASGDPIVCRHTNDPSSARNAARSPASFETTSHPVSQ